jgi:hypothetical protein
MGDITWNYKRLQKETDFFIFHFALAYMTDLGNTTHF